MNEHDEKNKRKTKLIILTLIAINIVLLIGIVCQFVSIKKLKNQLSSQQTSAYIEVIDKY